ncbi:MAG: DUF4157 domain-containing protein [Anaerolineae bacterium]
MTQSNSSDGNGRQQTKKEKPVQREDALEQEQAQQEVTFANMQMVQQAVANPEDANRNEIQGVQRALGNRFVQQMSRSHKSKINIPIQAKLAVNEINDPFEQEAEAVAEALPLHQTAAGSGSAGDGDSNPANQVDRAVESNDSGVVSSVESVSLAPALVEPEEELERSEEMASADAIVDIVPPVDGNDGGDSGDGPADNPDNPSNGHNGPGFDVSRVSAAESAGDGLAAEPKVVRTHVPTQLSGALFNPSIKSSLDRAAEIEEPEQLEEMGGLDRAAVPPVGNPDNPDEGDDEIALSADALSRDAAGEGFGGEDRAVHDPVENAIDRKRGGGQALDPAVQNQMEGHLGSDFSDVKVHTDNESDQLNRSLNAKAFTTGKDVFFSNGAYEPGSHSGQKLIAHELTHVVQQGGGVQKKPQRQTKSRRSNLGRKRRTNRPQQKLNRNSNRALYRSSAQAMDIIQRLPAGSRSIAQPLVSRAVTQQLLMRSSSEKEKAEKKAERGKNVASEKGSDADSAEGRAQKRSGEIDFRPAQQPKTKRIQDQKIEPTETRPQINPDEIEPIYSDMDTGGMGWADVKADTLPDWDEELTKYDAFNKGEYSALGVDLSGLEGDTAGITVDDPAIREQMVADALNGINQPQASNFGEKIAGIGDNMPYAGDNLAAETIFTDGPGQWWNGAKEQFGNDAKDVGEGFKDLFGSGTGSGWARMAGLLNAMIGLLSILRRVIQIIRMVTDIFYWIIKLFVALSKVPFIGSAFRWARPIASAILPFFSPMGMMVLQIDYLTSFFRSLAAAFLAIDMMYYETDPEKLMDRQAQLARHVAGMRNATSSGVQRGVSQKNKDEREAEQGMIGAEDLDDPRISPFTIEHSADAEAGTRQDYKDKFLAQYGVPDVADQVADQLMETRESLPPPPLREYGADSQEDVRFKVDQNGIAIMELERQKLGIQTTKQEAADMREVAQHEQQVFAQSQQAVTQNQEQIKPHTADMDHRMDKQTQMKGKSTEAGGTSGSAMTSGNKFMFLTGLIIKFVGLFMGPMQRTGATAPGNSRQEMGGGANKTNRGAQASAQASQKGKEQADERKVQTLQAKTEAKKSDGELGELNSELGGYKEEAQEGEEALTDEIDEMDEAVDLIESEEDRLIEERTEAINDAVNWMSAWREARLEIFTQVESDLDKRYKEDGEKDEDAEAEADIHDKDEDMESDGMYFTDEFEENDEFGDDW